MGHLAKILDVAVSDIFDGKLPMTAYGNMKSILFSDDSQCTVVTNPVLLEIIL